MCGTVGPPNFSDSFRNLLICNPFSLENTQTGAHVMLPLPRPPSPSPLLNLDSRARSVRVQIREIECTLNSIRGEEKRWFNFGCKIERISL